MNSLHSLAQEFQIPHAFLECYKTYVGITSKQMDKLVAASAVDVFATQAVSSNADNKVYNDQDTAYAVAVVTYILIEQPIEVFQRLTQLNAQLTEHQKYGIELLKYIMFQLDKQDTLVYLNTLMANKNIPNQPIQQGVEFSKIYSFVHLCGFAQLLKPLQEEMPIKYLLGSQSIISFDPHSVDSSLPILYQLAKSSPILVILKPDQVDIQKTVFLNHMKFMKDICIQLILDATTQSPSFITQSLQNQPYKFKSIEELGALIFAGQPNLEDRWQKFQKIPNIQKTLGFLINPQFNIEEARKQLKDQQETTVVQELTANSPQQAQVQFDPFKTQIQSTPQTQAIRRTMHY